MARSRELDDDAFRELRQYAPIVGATNALPMEFPAGFDAAGVRPRDPTRNTFIGITVSRPEEDLVGFGLAYYDHADEATDEDMYVLNLRSRDLTYYGRGRWENEDPRYAGTHHGDKSYLDELAELWSGSAERPPTETA